MPLALAKLGEDNLVKRVSGREETRLFLAKLGFVPGAHVSVVTQNGGNVITASDVQPSKTPSPMLVQARGMAIVASKPQTPKA
jgi:ferrous iron transport protein A